MSSLRNIYNEKDISIAEERRAPGLGYTKLTAEAICPINST